MVLTKNVPCRQSKAPVFHDPVALTKYLCLFVSMEFPIKHVDYITVD